MESNQKVCLRHYLSILNYSLLATDFVGVCSKSNLFLVFLVLVECHILCEAVKYFASDT